MWPELGTSLATVVAPRPEARGGSGTLIVVVGPSGAGKDSLIDYARQKLSADPAILFVRRTVTRQASVTAEDHSAMPVEQFEAAERAGAFAVTWCAHGLSYGLPMTAKDHVDTGGVAVANGSRAALPAITASFRNCAVVWVTARPDILALRLAARGREDATEIQRRLTRAAADYPASRDAIEIDNSGPLEIAGNRLLSTIQSFRG